MTAVDRVRRTQRSLGLIVGSSALLWAATALFALLAVAGLVGKYAALPPVAVTMLPIVALLGALVTLGVFAWRGRFAWSFDRVALWIEERAPELKYALVTAIDPRYRDKEGKLFEPVVARVDTGRFVRTAATQSVLPALVALVVATAAFTFLPKTPAGGSLRNIFGGGPAKPVIVGNRLTPLTAELTPPAYANIRSSSIDEPTMISSLQGSRVTFTGRGTPDGIHAALADKEIPVTAGGKGWTMSFTMSDTLPAALKFVDRQYSRLVVIDPHVDDPPTARLLLPKRDTTVRQIPQTLQLSAELNDEVGLGSATYEYIVASMNEGDAAEARTGTLGARSFGGAKHAMFDLSIPYATLKLEEGDILSIRAVVTDNNTLTGPHKGYSETRVIRVARKSEYDSLNINPAPPSADTAIMTLRMLIIATEKWDKLKPKLERKVFVDSSLKLGNKAETIRQKIQRIIDDQTGGGEIAADTLLTTALNAMWDATRSLYVAETGEAIPQMYIALKALQKYSNAKRYYLRGQLPPIIVNIDRVRMQGNDTGKAIARAARAVAGTERDRLRGQYVDALNQLRSQPQRALETFTLMQVATLRSQPVLAAALGDAIKAIQRGTDVTIPLLRARRELDGSAGAIDSLPPWSGSW